MICKELRIKELFPELGAEGRDPTLMLYLPSKIPEMGRQEERKPAILLCPGGGYEEISQRESEPIALQFLTSGFCVFVLNYSVKPHKFPTQLREVAAAMELIHQNAESWQVDRNRVAIMGFSAGGHLAAHYSVAYDCPQVRQMFPESKGVQASVLCYPVITSDSRHCHTGSIQAVSGHRELTREDVEWFSCERLVTDRTPPAFLWHTAEDSCVSVMNTLLYAQALAEHKVPMSVHIYPWGEHGLATVDNLTCDNLSEKASYARDWLDAAKKWLQIQLR